MGFDPRILLLGALCISIACGQTCRDYATCSECTAAAGCGWCVSAANLSGGSCLVGVREGSNSGPAECRTGAFGFWSYTHGQGCLALEGPGFDIIPNIGYKRSPNCVDRRHWESNCYPTSFGIAFPIIIILFVISTGYLLVALDRATLNSEGWDAANVLVYVCLTLAFAFALCSITNKSWTTITGGDRDRYFSPVFISIDEIGCWAIGDGSPNRYNSESSYCNLCHLANRAYVYRVPWLRRAADYSGENVVSRFCELVRTCAGLGLTAMGLLGLTVVMVGPPSKGRYSGTGGGILATVLAVIVALIWPPVALWREAHDSPYVQSYTSTPGTVVALGGSYRVYMGACVLVTFAFVLCLVKLLAWPKFLAFGPSLSGGELGNVTGTSFLPWRRSPPFDPVAVGRAAADRIIADMRRDAERPASSPHQYGVDVQVETHVDTSLGGRRSPRPTTPTTPRPASPHAASQLAASPRTARERPVAPPAADSNPGISPQRQPPPYPHTLLHRPVGLSTSSGSPPPTYPGTPTFSLPPPYPGPATLHPERGAAPVQESESSISPSFQSAAEHTERSSHV
jgi:hypothetical protein